MSGSDTDDGHVPWIGGPTPQNDGVRDAIRFDVVSDAESERVTFVPSDSDDGEPSTGRISVDMDLLVDLVEMR